MLFNVLYFLYMFLTNLVLSLYVRCPGSDRIAGRFLCSLNFPERQKSEEQFHMQCFYCSRVGFLVDWFLWTLCIHREEM